MWAVSELLKSCGIDSHHKQFRPFLQKLFKVCSKQWLQQSCIGVKTSTSEAMRDLVMKHKSAVLKLKSASPKHANINKDDSTSKNKSVANVRKVLFTDNMPKSDFKFKQFGSNLKSKELPCKNSNTTEGYDDFTVFLDIKKISSKNSKDQQTQPVSPTSDYCLNLDVDSKNLKNISAN